MLRNAETSTAPSNQDDPKKPINPFCNRFIAPTLVSFTGKTLGIASAILTTFPYSPALPAIAATAGLAAGISSGMSRYHLITKANIKPGVQLSEEGETLQPISQNDELNATAIVIASSSEALLEGYKTSLKTNKVSPLLAWIFVITSSYNQLVTGMQANGQKWFGEDGKNLSDTWTGYLSDKITTFDFDWVTKNIIDIKSLITTLKPTIEMSSQYVSVLDFTKSSGIPITSTASLIGIHTLAIAGSHTQHYAPRGYEQQIMQQNLKTDISQKKYSSWCLEKVADVIDGVAAVGAIPLDLLSIVLPPKFVVFGSQILGNSISGYNVYASILPKLPIGFLQSSYVAIPLITIGTAVYTYSEVTSLIAAWNQTVTLPKEKPLADEKDSATPPKQIQIGVLPLLNKKFGEPQPNDSYVTSVKKRFSNYKKYATNNMGHYYQSAGQYLRFFSSKNKKEPEAIPLTDFKAKPA
jgi:hypothetical protein